MGWDSERRPKKEDLWRWTEAERLAMIGLKGSVWDMDGFTAVTMVCLRIHSPTLYGVESRYTLGIEYRVQNTTWFMTVQTIGSSSLLSFPSPSWPALNFLKWADFPLWCTLQQLMPPMCDSRWSKCFNSLPFWSIAIMLSRSLVSYI